MKKRSWLLLNLGLIGIAGLVAGFFGYRGLKQQLPQIVKNPSVKSSLSRAVSKAMKVEGEFGPLTLKEWTVQTPYFLGKGWPGEAIGALEATNIQAVFNPGAVLRRVWQVDSIKVASGRFALRTPNDALKRPPSQEKRPWYAILMPQRFYCPQIVCPQAEVAFPFQAGTGFLHQVQIQATMVGQDFKYFITGGTLNFPLLPPLAVKKLNLFVTREKVDIEEALLVGQETNASRVTLQGRVGMRDDKSISAKLAVEQLPFSQTLPPLLKDRLKGFVTGNMLWETDSSGENTVSSGKLQLHQTRLEAWPWLESIAKRYKNPDLLRMDFDQAKCSFDYQNDRFHVGGLDLKARDKARLQGWAAYDWKKEEGEFNINFSEMPLSSWLEMTLKPRVNAELRGRLWWKGSIKDIEKSQATGQVILDGAELLKPQRLKQFLNTYSLRFPDYFYVERARSDFIYWNQTLQATTFEFVAPKYFQIRGKFDYANRKDLSLTSDFSLKNITSFLPERFEKSFFGQVKGFAKWFGTQNNLAEGYGSGTLNIEQGRVQNLKLLKNLSRFLKDNSYQKLTLDRASLKWEKDVKDQIYFRDIDFISKGECGIQGNLVVDAKFNLSGKIKVGLKAEALRWLPKAETTIFREKREGLYWATVTLSGTLQKPKEDLSSQIKRVLLRHPGALIRLAWRGMSWWLGDIFGFEP